MAGKGKGLEDSSAQFGIAGSVAAYFLEFPEPFKIPSKQVVTRITQRH